MSAHDSAYDDPAKTEPLDKQERQAARQHAIAIGEHVAELGNAGPEWLARADLLLLAEQVVRLVDQIDRGPHPIPGQVDIFGGVA